MKIYREKEKIQLIFKKLNFFGDRKKYRNYKVSGETSTSCDNWYWTYLMKINDLKSGQNYFQISNFKQNKTDFPKRKGLNALNYPYSFLKTLCSLAGGREGIMRGEYHCVTN